MTEALEFGIGNAEFGMKGVLCELQDTNSRIILNLERSHKLRKTAIYTPLCRGEAL